MTIRLLRTLVAIADHKTFSAAADVVHVTHAAVSQQMQALEADLGLTLFDRSKRTPQLTPVARQVVARARRLIADYDNLVPSVLADGGLTGTIRLGVVGTMLTGLMPQAMVVLKARHPGMGLHIRPGLTGGLLAELERGTLDAAVITRPHLMPAGTTFHALAEERLELITAPDAQGDDPVALLQDNPFIRFNRTAVLGALIDTWLLTRGITVNEAMELDGAQAIASMVHANLGVSIMPRLAVPEPEGVALRRISLGEEAPVRVLGLAWREDQLKGAAMKAVAGALASVIEAAKVDGEAS